MPSASQTSLSRSLYWRRCRDWCCPSRACYRQCSLTRYRQWHNYVSDLLNALRDIRTEAAFSKLFEEAALLADLLGIVLSKPRTASRSVYRAAAGADGAVCATEEYYRVNYYFATLDAVITDIELRFGARQKQAMNISRLIPRLMSFGVGYSERQWEQLQEAKSQSEALLEDPAVIVKSEFDLWRQKWERVAEDKRPSTGLSTLDHCETDGYYRNIAMLLQILATLPVMTAEAERLFSSLSGSWRPSDRPWKRRDWRHSSCYKCTSNSLLSSRESSTTEEKRLEALLMLQVHKDLTPSIATVIDHGREATGGTHHATSAQGPHSFHRGSHRQIRYDFCAQIDICVVVGSFIDIIAQFCLVNVTTCHMCCVHAISIQDMSTFAVPLAWVYLKYWKYIKLFWFNYWLQDVYIITHGITLSNV